MRKTRNKKKEGKKNVTKKIFFKIISIIFVTVGLLVGAHVLFRYRFKQAYNTAQQETYDQYYGIGYDQGFQGNHVTNTVGISVDGIQEANDLEVLKVRDVEIVIEDKTTNDNNTIVWLEVPGEATFNVNLNAAECIVDDARKYVLIRVPEPELANLTIDYGEVRKLLFKNDVFDESIRVGAVMAQKMVNQGELFRIKH